MYAAFSSFTSKNRCNIKKSCVLIGAVVLAPIFRNYISLWRSSICHIVPTTKFASELDQTGRVNGVVVDDTIPGKLTNLLGESKQYVPLTPQLQHAKPSPFSNTTTTTTNVTRLPLKLPTLNTTRSILYLHVGKTGGTSLDRILPSNCEWYHVQERIQKCADGLTPENEQIPLSQLTKKSIHMQRITGIERFITRHHITSFFFTIRNPTSRAVSAFNIRHYDNQSRGSGKFRDRVFYLDCFPTVEDLAMVLAKRKEVAFQDRNGVLRDCFSLGERAITGRDHEYYDRGHLFWNYEWYTNVSTRVHPEKEVLVIRTEELWNDASHLNKLLMVDGAEIDTNTSTTSTNGFKFDEDNARVFHRLRDFRESYGIEEKQVTSGLSREGKAVICCFLSSENQIYENLLRNAVNIDQSGKDKYLDQLYYDCGISERPNDDLFWYKWKRSCQNTTNL